MATTLEEMRRFFGPQTYGDQDANAMPDMFNEIDPTLESYMGVPVDEFGEKTNPLGRSMDRALRRFFGIDNFAPSPAANMVSLDSEANDDDDNVADNLRTTYDEGNPPILKKVTTETLSPIEKSAPEGTFGFGPVAEEAPQKLISNNTRQQISPELLNRIVRMLAT